MDIFIPAFGDTTSVTNATSATAAVQLPRQCDNVLLTNTSSTARVHVIITPFDGVSAPTGVAPTTSTGLPILPGQQIRIGIDRGGNVIRTIATAADGAILITPGRNK